MFRTFSLASFVLALCGLSCLSAEARPDSKMTFEVYKGKNDQYRWRLKDGDATVATGGQGYKAKGDAKKGVASVQKAAANPKSNFEVYEDDAKNQRWRLKASNGQTIASSSGSFKTKADAEKAVAAVRAGAPKAEVIELK
jgi:uncharacterized protein YegP (UPF0339 family)